jgi:hypothetical protein
LEGPSQAISGLVSDPAVRAEADVGVALLAIGAGSTCHIEWHRADIAFLDVFNLRADLDDLSGVLMAHQHSRASGEATVVNVQVAAANVGGHEHENDTIFRALGSASLGYLASRISILLGPTNVTARLLVMCWMP